MRCFAILPLICLFLPLPGAAGSPPRPSAIPFTQAVAASLDGRSFTISWRAPGAGHILIYAGTTANAAGRHRPVAGGRASGRAAVADLPPAPRWYFDLVPQHGQDLVIAERSLHLADASNFRDIGGYRTREGQWVRMGLAYRSNALDHLAAPDLAVLDNLHLKWICDLRTAGERRHGADILPPGVPDISADVLADDTGKLRAIMASAPANGAPVTDPTAVAHDLYRDFVTIPSARRAYHTLFLRLADPAQLPTVFHCSAGKDRTGWAAAILLTILDVPHDVIVNDYVMTNIYLRGADVARLHAAIGSNSVASRLALISDPSDLEAAFAQVRTTYGSFDRYLREGLDLNDATLAAIRRNFLAGQPS